MIRESKMTFKQVGKSSCDIYCETRDDYGVWTRQGVIPTMGTIAEAMAQQTAKHERWGWMAYDSTEENVLTFWKEL